MKLIEMDGFIGCSVAAESIIDATTILHGPGGCRIHLSRLSARYVKREFVTREGDYFFHQPRVPCTFVDRDDYIYGASKKVSFILDMLESENTLFATILQSPGASLIGDKLQDEVVSKGLDGKTVVMDTSFMSERFSAGFDITMTRIAEKLASRKERRRMTANIIGLPFTSRGCYRLMAELRSMLARLGIEVIAFIGAGCTLEEMRESASAEFNICIHPEYCAVLSKFYENSLSIPCLRSDMGAPIGPYAMRAFVRNIADAYGIDPSPVISEMDEDDRLIDITIGASMDVGQKLNYKTFSIMGESSVAYPIADYMIRSLKMIPECIHITEHDPLMDDRIYEMLESVGCRSALGAEFGSEYTNILFGPGSYVKLLQAQGRCGVGIDIALPSQDMIDIAPKSVMGADGYHKMLDDILNSR